MALPWLTVLQSVPWSDVIRNAPKVAEGAKKLWRAVAKRPDAAPLQPVAVATDPATVPSRLAALETTVADLHSQMLASTELIQALAEQNTQLIARLAAQDRRLRWLGWVAAMLVLVCACLAWRVWR